MNPRTRIFPWPTFLVLMVLLFSAGGPAAGQEVEPDEGGPLFVAVDGAAGGASLAPEVIRGRTVTINTSALRPSGDQPPAQTIELNLFENETWLARQIRVESNPTGSYTWLGTLEGNPHSSVILVVRDGLLTGKVAVDNNVYTIDPSGTVFHEILQVDPSVINPEDTDDGLIPPPELIGSDPGQPEGDVEGVTVASDDGSVLDVMVVYTAAARTTAGSTAAIESRIELGISETNQAYEQSGVSQRVFLVHMEEVVYTESGDVSTDLGRLANTSDGFMDNVHTLRNTYHADFVKLVVSAGGAGVAYLQSTISPAFSSSAFSVTQYSAISPNYTFAHELGHNMGLRHDWYVDHDQTPFTHAHGFADRSESWRTIMAYNNVCSDDGGSCTRLLYFSNPNNSFGGNPMGVATGTSNSCVETSYSPDPESCDAHNSSVLDASAANNAGFRTSSKTWLGNSTDWNSTANWSDGIVPRFLDDIFIPAAPTGGNFPTTSGTAAVRNVTIENGASATMTGGTLTVYGDWDEVGTGVFTATAGTIQFVGPITQTISQNAGSAFFNVEIGDGTGETNVDLGSDLDINGNLTLKANAKLHGGTQTINVAGNWDDQGDGFSQGTSTVVLDGNTQSVDKVTTTTLLTEDFNTYTSCGCTSGAPTGWARESTAGNGFLFGKLSSAPDGSAVLWHDTVSPEVGWLFSSSVYLEPGVNYQLSFKTADYFGAASITMETYLGISQSSASMSTLIGAAADPPGTNVYQTTVQNFTVSTAGTYYIGWKGVQSTHYTLLDDISLTGTKDPTFYNLQVSSTGSATLNKDAVVQNDLTTTSGGTLNLNGQAISVEGAVANNGGLRDTLPTPTSTTTNFLVIQDAAAAITKYQGVDFTPTAGSIINTTITVKGNQDCTTDNTSASVRRCFDISPDAAGTATVRFYYLAAEANSNPQGGTNIYHWNSTTSAWDLLTGTLTFGGTDPRWTQITDVSSFSPFVLDDSSPTAVTFSEEATTYEPAGNFVIGFSLMLLTVTCVIIWCRRVPW